MISCLLKFVPYQNEYIWGPSIYNTNGGQFVAGQFVADNSSPDNSSHGQFVA